MNLPAIPTDLATWTRIILPIVGAIVAVVLGWLFLENGFVSINLYIASALGIGGTVMLTVALLGLVFLSSGTGHDAAVVDPLADE